MKFWWKVGNITQILSDCRWCAISGTAMKVTFLKNYYASTGKNKFNIEDFVLQAHVRPQTESNPSKSLIWLFFYVVKEVHEIKSMGRGRMNCSLSQLICHPFQSFAFIWDKVWVCLKQCYILNTFFFKCTRVSLRSPAKRDANSRVALHKSGGKGVLSDREKWDTLSVYSLRSG